MAPLVLSHDAAIASRCLLFVTALWQLGAPGYGKKAVKSVSLQQTAPFYRDKETINHLLHGTYDAAVPCLRVVAITADVVYDALEEW